MKKNSTLSNDIYYSRQCEVWYHVSCNFLRALSRIVEYDTDFFIWDVKPWFFVSIHCVLQW